MDEGGRGAGAPHLPAEGGPRPRRGPHRVRGAGAQHSRHPGQGVHDRDNRRETQCVITKFGFPATVMALGRSNRLQRDLPSCSFDQVVSAGRWLLEAGR